MRIIPSLNVTDYSPDYTLVAISQIFVLQKSFSRLRSYRLDLESSRFDSVIGFDADDGIHFGKGLLTHALSAITDLLAGAKTHLSRIGSLMFIAVVTSSREWFQSCERLFKSGAFRV